VTNLQQLRVYAVSHSLFHPVTLKAALKRMGFVQADPIRSPARAQDLILRHRVNGYQAGDLERHYGSLDIEEDDLYAYGFLSREVWQLLHPRTATRLPKLDQRVLELVRSVGAMAGVLDGVDAIVFTGGVGENSARVRADVAAALGFAGLRLGADSGGTGDRLISSGESHISALLVHAREDLVILDEVLRQPSPRS